MQDVFGQTTTLSSATALESWNKTQLAFLAHGASTPTHLGATLAEASDFALAHAVKAMFYLLLGRKELIATAEEARASALASVAQNPVSTREQHFIDALVVWMKGQPLAALAHFEAIIAANPTDILALKLDHAVRFVFGDADCAYRCDCVIKRTGISN